MAQCKTFALICCLFNSAELGTWYVFASYPTFLSVKLIGGCMFSVTFLFMSVYPRLKLIGDSKFSRAFHVMSVCPRLKRIGDSMFSRAFHFMSVYPRLKLVVGCIFSRAFHFMSLCPRLKHGVHVFPDFSLEIFFFCDKNRTFSYDCLLFSAW